MAFSFLLVLVVMMAGGQRQRKKARGQSSQPVEPPSRSPDMDDIAYVEVDRFVSGEAEARYEKLSRRGFIAARKVVFEELDPMLAEDFAYQGWADLVSYEAPVYQNLVRDFASNLTYTTDNDGIMTIRTRVARRDIEFDEPTLAGILGVPFGGSRHHTSKEWNVIQGTDISFLQARSDVLRGDGTGINLLTARDRVLHKIIRGSANPTAGNYTNVTTLDIFFIYCIKHRVRVNFTYTLLKIFITRTSSAKGSIPFATYLTKIFAYMNVILNIEPFLPFKKIDQEIGLLALNHMGITLVGTEYIRTNEEPPQQNNPLILYEPRPQPEASSSAPPPPPTYDSTFQTQVLEALANLTTGFTGMKGDFIALREDVQLYKASNDRQLGEMQAAFQAYQRVQQDNYRSLSERLDKALGVEPPPEEEEEDEQDDMEDD